MSSAPTTALDREDLRRTIAAVIDVAVEEVDDHTLFVDELGADSLMALEVVVVLEKKYGVRLHESELKHVTCVSAAYDLLYSKLSEASGGPGPR